MTNNLKKNWRLYLSMVVGIAAAVFIYLQWDSIRVSLNTLKGANFGYILAALVSFSFTVVSASGVIYMLRINKKTKYRPVLLVQVSTLFLARITPASVGGLAAMGRVLVTQGQTVVQAGSIVAAGGIATFVGNVILTSFALLLSANSVDLGNISIPNFIIYVFIAGAIIIGGLMLIKKIRVKVTRAIKDVISTIGIYKNRKKSLVAAVFFGFMVTLMYGITMLLVAQSLGVHLSLLAGIIVISLGSLGVAVTPLPGGAVGAEAALAAGLTQFGVSATDAIAIALVYRAVTFWIPLLPGFIASQFALKKEYL